MTGGESTNRDLWVSKIRAAGEEIDNSTASPDIKLIAWILLSVENYEDETGERLSWRRVLEIGINNLGGINALLGSS